MDCKSRQKRDERVSFSFSPSADARGAEQTHRRPPGAHQTPAGEARQAERAHQDAAESGGRNGFTQTTLT